MWDSKKSQKATRDTLGLELKMPPQYETRKKKKERKKVKVFIIRIITNIVGETTRVGCESHGWFGIFDIRDISYQTKNITCNDRKFSPS